MSEILRYFGQKSQDKLRGLMFLRCCAIDEPCEVCGTKADLLYLVDGIKRCVSCGKRWRVTKTGVVLRLAAKNDRKDNSHV